jgi:hypothetical protein
MREDLGTAGRPRGGFPWYFQSSQKSPDQLHKGGENAMPKKFGINSKAAEVFLDA